MDFDLRLLRHARALADEGNFARAARAQHITQPALSRSIQELERRTGIRLFDRGTNRVEPTDLGRVFLAHARELLVRAEALDREVRTLRGVGTGLLAIGSGVFPTAMFMQDAIAAFLDRNPGVGIRLVNSVWTALAAALRRRELDFMVSATPPSEDTGGLAAQPLSPREGVFVVNPSHPLAGAKALTLADIAAHPLVCSAQMPASLIDIVVGKRGAAAANRPIPDVACESHEMMCTIAATTKHVVLTSPSAAARWLEDGKLVVLPPVEPAIVVPFAVLRVEGRTLSPVAEEMIRDIVEADRKSAELDRTLIARSRSVRRVRRAAASGSR